MSEFNKNGSLNRKTILQFKNVSLRKFLVGKNIKELGEKLKTRAGFHKVRVQQDGDVGRLIIGKNGKELAEISYTYVSSRKMDGVFNAMHEATLLNNLIAKALTPEIPQDAVHCPKCGGEDISWDRLEADGNSASQGGFCTNCQCRWATVFTFTHNEILN